MKTESRKMRIEFEQELNNIANYWAQHSVDTEYGGFYGQIYNDGTITKQAKKGAVLNARILWFFSAAYNYNLVSENLKLAERAFDYFKNHFIDFEFGGVYWLLDFNGKPIETKKQIYAIAFAIYGLTEFYKASNNQEALTIAQSLYTNIEVHSFDSKKNGYFEAYSREWKTVSDFRLSDKDAMEKKTMNTHLHIIEAYSNLYSVWPNEELHKRIQNLLFIFSDHIINKKKGHLDLFFDEDWVVKSSAISFGHDIEASWLLLEAAEILKDDKLIEQFSKISLSLAASALRGLDTNGGLNYEYENGLWNKEKHWWVQAEALVGFYNAFQLTNNSVYYHAHETCWTFIKNHILDHEYGEWVWGVKENLSLIDNQYKAGLWKCPYHNGRACLEIINRVGKRSIQTV